MAGEMVSRIVAVIVVILVVAFGAFYAWAWHSEIEPGAPVSAAAFDPGIVSKGARLAAAGNCASCHTQAGGKAYAGGYPVETPFGTIYSTNVTPDPETGIGGWTEAAFKRALRVGVDRRGRHLYPAFPYDHFTRLNESDINALYAFLMSRTPVRQENRAPQLPFPLNIRLSAAAWKLLYLREGPLQPERGQSAEWNRGAYLAQALAHCGACHTPRNALGAEKSGNQYSGGEGEGWNAPALNATSPAPAPWTADQLYSYLRGGFASEHGYAAGPMREAAQGLQELSEDDVRAIAIYVASFSDTPNQALRDKAKGAFEFAKERESQVGVRELATTGSAGDKGNDNGNSRPDGAAIFAGACASCHHDGGQMPVSRPIELGLSTTVNESDPTNLLRIVVDGIHPPAGERGPIMPGFSGALTDPQIVAVAAHVRRQFSRKTAWPDVAGALTRLRANRQTTRAGR